MYPNKIHFHIELNIIYKIDRDLSLHYINNQ